MWWEGESDRPSSSDFPTTSARTKSGRSGSAPTRRTPGGLWLERRPPRGAAEPAVLNGRMHVLGGEAYLNDLVGTYRTHEAFDPKTNAWQRLPPMPTPRHGLAVA